MGISKREFMEDYFLDEFITVTEQYGRLNSIQEEGEEEVFIDELGF